MQSEAERAEILALLKAAQEQVAYLKELGVEGTEKFTDTSLRQELSSDKPNPPYAAATPHPQVPAASTATDSLFGDLSASPIRIEKSSETFEEIWADIGDCTRCPLYQGRTNIVHTDGNRKARLMFV